MLEKIQAPIAGDALLFYEMVILLGCIEERLNREVAYRRDLPTAVRECIKHWIKVMCSSELYSARSNL